MSDKPKTAVQWYSNIMKDFVPYEQALALKELGFDEYCLALITPNGNLESIDMEDWEKVSGTILAPLYQQAFRWFREKYDLYSI